MKAAHAIAHPDYELKPRSSSEISRRPGTKTAEKAAESAAKKSSRKSSKVAQKNQPAASQASAANNQPPFAGAHPPVNAQQPVQAPMPFQPYFPQQPAQPPAGGFYQPSYEAPGQNMANLAGPSFGMPAQFPPQGYQPMAPPFLANGNYQNAGGMSQGGFGGFYNYQQFQQAGTGDQNSGNMGFGAGQPGNNGWC